MMEGATITRVLVMDCLTDGQVSTAKNYVYQSLTYDYLNIRGESARLACEAEKAGWMGRCNFGCGVLTQPSGVESMPPQYENGPKPNLTHDKSKPPQVVH
jgi:hypothetical protein